MFKRLLKKIFYSIVFREIDTLETLGEKNKGPWTVSVKNLNADSIVYSAGVGEDISFEIELCEQFSCNVILLDPTPVALKTLKNKKYQHPKIEFLQLGLSNSAGSVKFSYPPGSEEISFTLKREAEDKFVEFSTTTLKNLMKRYIHDHIDLLKMDIEGFEYGIIKQICQNKIPIKQICLEFHHWMLPGISKWSTISSILKLAKIGYRVVNIRSWDYTFVHKSLLRKG